MLEVVSKEEPDCSMMQNNIAGLPVEQWGRQVSSAYKGLSHSW